MVSRTAQCVKKRPSVCKASAGKPKLRSTKATSATSCSNGKAVLKHQLAVSKDASGSCDWREFTPLIINEHCCQARTWDDGHGGQCTRAPLTDSVHLCAAHKLESELPLGLAHGFVSGAIPAGKLAEFQRVRSFREAARQKATRITDNDSVASDIITDHGDVQQRYVQCWRPKVINLQDKSSKYLKGNYACSREHFEELAVVASRDAPQYLFERIGYPVPLLGSLHCILRGFERDLDGIRPSSICVYEWQFSHERIDDVKTVEIMKHKCRNFWYKRQVPRPPLRVRVAACVVCVLVNTQIASCFHNVGVAVQDFVMN